MHSYERRSEPASNGAATDECSNCNRDTGRERELLCDQQLELDIVLCQTCLEAYLDEDWIQAVSK